jgi:hypothetical protein
MGLVLWGRTGARVYELLVDALHGLLAFFRVFCRYRRSPDTSDGPNHNRNAGLLVVSVRRSCRRRGDWANECMGRGGVLSVDSLARERDGNRGVGGALNVLLIPAPARRVAVAFMGFGGGRGGGACADGFCSVGGGAGGLGSVHA